MPMEAHGTEVVAALGSVPAVSAQSSELARRRRRVRSRVATTAAAIRATPAHIVHGRREEAPVGGVTPKYTVGAGRASRPGTPSHACVEPSAECTVIGNLITAGFGASPRKLKSATPPGAMLPPRYSMALPATVSCHEGSRTGASSVKPFGIVISTPVIATVTSAGTAIVTVTDRRAGSCDTVGNGCAPATPDIRRTSTMARAISAARRTLATVATMLVLLVISAGPASAHSVSGQGATNFETRVRSMTPAIPGVSINVVEAGSRLELTNGTGKTVTVLGYQGEPYLRVGPDGVFENRRSPAVYLNSVRRNPPPAPPDADPSAPPQWQRISSGTSVRWHDHRTHWMGTQNPPIVQRAPGTFHVVIPRWTIELRVGDAPVTIAGDLVWRPGPTPMPWFAVAVVLLVALVLVARYLPWRLVVAGAAALLVAADIAHATGIAFVTAGSLGSHLGRLVTASPYSVAAWLLGIGGAIALARRPDLGLRAIAFSGIIIAIFGGILDRHDLDRSHIPTTLAPALARLAVTLSLGLGVGLAAATIVLVTRGRDRPPIADG